jgi:hypothetical protein
MNDTSPTLAVIITLTFTPAHNPNPKANQSETMPHTLAMLMGKVGAREWVVVTQASMSALIT